MLMGVATQYSRSRGNFSVITQWHDMKTPLSKGIVFNCVSVSKLKNVQIWCGVVLADR